MRHPSLTLALALGLAGLFGCQRGDVADAGEMDAGVIGPSCDSPEDCRGAQFEGVCRQNICIANVPCGDDVECGLGERCVTGQCRFTGCAQDAECNSGSCRLDVFSCEECGSDDACPFDKPRCDTAAHRCVSCLEDSECPAQGASYCSAFGACVHCTESKHCPVGLNCGPAGVCLGAGLNASCSTGVACAEGLLCVNVGAVGRCLAQCELLRPNCPTGQICYLPYGTVNQLVYEQGQPKGFCFAPQAGRRGVDEPCLKTDTTSNCQGNLECVADGVSTATCRALCDPALTSNCGNGSVCHPFNGDHLGHRYGLCYPNNGWGDDCGADAGCGNGQTCLLKPDPAASTNFSPKCQYPVGAGLGLSPCSADTACQSGSCQTDGTFTLNSYFCFQHCGQDSECTVGGRTGRCDADFSYQKEGSFGYVRGCRPHCASNADCTGYDAGFICRARLDVFSEANELQQGCGPAGQGAELGSACVSSNDCRSGFCSGNDWRGTPRRGVCTAPCVTTSDCSLRDGGPASSVECGVIPYLRETGEDNLANTADDVVFNASLCWGKGCIDDSECSSADGGSFCAPSGERNDAGLVLRCQRPPNYASLLPGAASCNFDLECQSGVCGHLVSPSSGRVCLASCGAGTTCPGGTTCRDASLEVTTSTGRVRVRACVP